MELWSTRFWKHGAISEDHVTQPVFNNDHVKFRLRAPALLCKPLKAVCVGDCDGEEGFDWLQEQFLLLLPVLCRKRAGGGGDGV
jgi:hypothetical protein